MQRKSLAGALTLSVALATLLPAAVVRSDEEDEIDGASLRRRLVELESRIQAVIGEARAERPEQCRAIGIGAKPCGGPWRYLVYSTVATDGARLEGLVAEYNALDRRRNAEEGLVSDCAFVGPPALSLVGGRCAGRGH